MYKGKKILAVIPARGGSKGIKDKNIIDLNGKPLIQYTIDAALESKYVDKVIVSTDSQRIADVSEALGAEVPFLRPAELATDHAKTIDCIIHLLNKLEEKSEKYDYCVLLQPTSPLRLSSHIDEAIEKIIDNDYESIVGISEVEDHPVLIRTMEDDNHLTKLMDENSTVRRQDFKKYYRVNGSIYINKVDDINDSTSLNDNTYGYIMEKKYSVDIDSENDLMYAQVLLKSRYD